MRVLIRWRATAVLLAAGLAGFARAGDLTADEALAQLKAIGGVLVHFDERQPGRPVILVDFTNHPSFKPEWLKCLAAFPHLTGLGLSGTSLTDEGLRYVKNLPALETLSLAETKVTDEGLAELLGLKKLRHLDVRDTGVTAVGVKVLKKYLPDVEVDSGAAEPEARKPAAEQPPVTSATRLNALREKAAELSQRAEGQEEPPPGWSKSGVDPARLVELFPPLRVRPGYVLRAYVFREDGNGNGVVWALPDDAEFPAPADCPTLESHMLKAPKPSEALDDAMEAIEGDGTPAGYLAASLLRRELREFGASWHGCKWRTHWILDADPWQSGPSPEDTSPLERPTSSLREWTWHEPRPADWRPRVTVDGDRATVTFYTYSGLEKQGVYRHTDTYRAGRLRPKVEEKLIGEGPAGYVF